MASAAADAIVIELLYHRRLFLCRPIDISYEEDFGREMV